MSKAHYIPEHIEYYKYVFSPWVRPSAPVGEVTASSTREDAEAFAQYAAENPTYGANAPWESTGPTAWWQWRLPAAMRLTAINLKNGSFSKVVNNTTYTYYLGKTARIYSDAGKSKPLTDVFTLPSNNTTVLSVPVLPNVGLIETIYIDITASYNSYAGFGYIHLVGEYATSSTPATQADYDYSVIKPATDITGAYTLNRGGRLYGLMRGGKPFTLRR